MTAYQWQTNIVSVLTRKSNEMGGALWTVIHSGSIFLAQLMLLVVYPSYNITAYTPAVAGEVYI